MLDISRIKIVVCRRDRAKGGVLKLAQVNALTAPVKRIEKKSTLMERPENLPKRELKGDRCNLKNIQ